MLAQSVRQLLNCSLGVLHYQLLPDNSAEDMKSKVDLCNGTGGLKKVSVK